MVLNVIDFNNNLQKSYRNRYCIYRNLELGHEIHVYNENSKLIKACRQTLSPNIKKTLDSLHFSYTYELYKLFLMLNVGGWFIEADQIIYSPPSVPPEKTMPCYSSLNNCNVVTFATWVPIFIKNDKATNFYLKKSLDTLKMNLENGIYDFLYREMTYQLIYIAPFFEGMSPEFIIPSFCQKYDLGFDHYISSAITSRLIHRDDIENTDTDYVLHYLFVDYGIEAGYDEFSFNSLLKFDTFKIMP